VTDLHDADPADSAEAGLWASDALLDALGAGAPLAGDRTSALLSALVSDVSADPLPALPRAPRRRSSHRLAPRTGVAAAAVVAMLSTGGVAAASVNAGPTSPLFPLHQVLTGRPQLDGSQRQAMEIKDKLKSATKALASGKVARAQKDVAAAADRLPKVAARDGHTALAAEWTRISKQVKAQVGATPTAVKPVTSLSPTPTHTVTPGRSTSAAPSTTAAAPTVSPAPVTSVTSPPATPTSPPAAGVGPTTGLTTPAPTATGSVTPTPSATPSTTPSPSDSAGTGSPTQTPSTTSSEHHKPGGGSVAPGSPPAPSLEPPSSHPPVTVPVVSEAPVTVPPASVPADTTPLVLPSAVALTPSDG
jgi:hypothetical protein